MAVYSCCPNRSGPHWLGDVAMPPAFTVLEIGDDYVLGIHRDDLDVQRVQIYRMMKPNHP